MTRRGVVLIALVAALPVAQPALRPTEIVSLTIVPQEVSGGARTSGSIRLDRAAPGPLRIELSSTNPAIASVPSSITVAAGARTAVFPIRTFAERAGCARIGARVGNGSAHADELFVTPPATPAGAPVSLRVESSTVVAAGSAQALVQLAQPAPDGGISVRISSDNPAFAAVPAVIEIPQRATSQRFSISTSPVAATTCAVVSAAAGGSTSRVLLKIVGTSK